MSTHQVKFKDNFNFDDTVLSKPHAIQQTSIEAYRDIQESLGDRQKRIYVLIKSLGSPTNKEISTFGGIEINCVTPRTNELVKKGLVQECKKRICKISGRTAIAWSIV